MEFYTVNLGNPDVLCMTNELFYTLEWNVLKDGTRYIEETLEVS